MEIRNDADTCKIQITPDGVINFIGTKSVFHHPVEMQQTLNVAGAATMQSTMNAVGKSTLSAASIGGIEFGTHKHSGVQSGSSDTGNPK